MTLECPVWVTEVYRRPMTEAERRGGYGGMYMECAELTPANKTAERIDEARRRERSKEASDEKGV